MSTIWSWEQNSPLSVPKPPPELRLPPHSLGRSMVVRIRRGNAFAGAKPLPIVCSVELLAGWLTFSYFVQLRRRVFTCSDKAKMDTDTILRTN